MLGLSISPDGSVWVATTTVLARIDRAGRWIAAALPVVPSGPPVAASGAIWVPCCWVVESEHASLPLEGWLLRVDPATNQAVFMSDPPTGVVWQVDPYQHRFIASMTVSQGGPLAAAAGVVWAGGASSLVPLTGPNAGGDGPRLLDPLGRWITGLAASADTLWVATSDALYRIDRRKLR